MFYKSYNSSWVIRDIFHEYIVYSNEKLMLKIEKYYYLSIIFQVMMYHYLIYQFIFLLLNNTSVLQSLDQNIVQKIP
ncbi:hypothetical protein HERIO_289 [Hepatospora eriocheir]|uniref:Uncharacterized protein n=1 Tax=Hepatospora eriocheir TaxID=1081669 RepID=A0A1X0QDN8_9MICR|nr:hypothetical protein HERIO_289 [Hepatospora eriocheir]